jgi:hypothetical protein
LNFPSKKRPKIFILKLNVVEKALKRQKTLLYAPKNT